MGERVAVIGSGYVGTVVAACLAFVGNDVVAVESDTKRLSQLARGDVPFHEPGLEPILKKMVQDGALRFTDDFSLAMDKSDIVFVCVGTPPGPDGSPEMSAMREVARQIGQNLRSHHVIVTKSTVPIGTSNWMGSVIEDYVESDHPEDLFSLVSNPEFLREGNAIQDYLHPDRVVLGSDDPAALRRVTEVYRPILDQEIPGDVGRREPVPLLTARMTTAEMIKYASNAFLATKISFANEMARLCDFVGADITEVTAGMGLDHRIGGQFLDAGIGWGGSCFGKDLAALISTAADYGYRPPVLEGAVAVNQSQRQMVIDELLRHLKTLRGTRICLLGLAFKPETDDLRDSPALSVAKRLLDRGAFVIAHDPMVTELPDIPDIRMMPDPYSASVGADAVIVATEWNQFLSLDLGRLKVLMRGDVFFDGRNIFDADSVRAAGFRYAGVGRPAMPNQVVRESAPQSALPPAPHPALSQGPAPTSVPAPVVADVPLPRSLRGTRRPLTTT